mgnify:CR=1 FL=1
MFAAKYFGSNQAAQVKAERWLRELSSHKASNTPLFVLSNIEQRSASEPIVYTDSYGQWWTGRYIGSLVSDFHRNLLKGGIYIYPKGTLAPKGKLRLLYECNPLAFIAEQAGGVASDGKNRIMEIVPTELHQRVPYFIGSKNMVEKAEEFIATYGE